MQVRSDGEDLLALHQDVRLREVAHLRVHRQHGAAAKDVAPSRPATVRGRIASVRGGRACRKEIGTSRDGGPRRGGGLQEIAPRSGMTPRNSLVTPFGHWLPPHIESFPVEARGPPEADLSDVGAPSCVAGGALAARPAPRYSADD